MLLRAWACNVYALKIVKGSRSQRTFLALEIMKASWSRCTWSWEHEVRSWAHNPMLSRAWTTIKTGSNPGLGPVAPGCSGRKGKRGRGRGGGGRVCVWGFECVGQDHEPFMLSLRSWTFHAYVEIMNFTCSLLEHEPSMLSSEDIYLLKIINEFVSYPAN